ncbi:hypothetical protein [Streptomyces sp. CB03911]|uniref:hypothetical protein n=1 Tax=Streptomyces sp. CB03911 TaxID=1804758 RepID=UPI00093BA146|nr:hypothetical protein [Streptomyces sp. CB03911]OKI16624.1 hypothetical protein A6A07_11495 [Streptomyces sp. CB03911]
MVDAWTDTATTLAITGVETTDQQLLQAQADIEIFAGRIWTDTARIRTRDLYWLGRAVAFQAVWAQGQPGRETRMDLTSSTQDGVSANLTGDAVVLAPMAARAVNRLSWRRSRTVHVRSPFIDGSSYGNPLHEANDDLRPWTPMGPGC